ncbi:MAG: phage tail sheath subtilisin-like domain-containing protein [Saprospiraceae bacterium]|nr:phage tail sheath subtilisin-like domain-containing protein [Lewinella sp.]
MAIQPTYPGVYVQEVPSGVRTIVGVSTSVTAFVGTAKRGPINKPVYIFGYPDFERKFGGLDSSSEMSYAVRQFFSSGGSQAIIVRVALNPVAATRQLDDATPLSALVVTAVDQGSSGNFIELEVNYDTSNPDSTFNLIVNYVSPDNASENRTETFSNLSMNSQHARYVEHVVNGVSELVTVNRTAAVAGLGAGEVFSGEVADVATLLDATHNSLRVAVNGSEPVAITLDPGTYTGGANANARLDAVCTAIQNTVTAGSGTNPLLAGFTCVRDASLGFNRIHMTSGVAGENSRIEILPGLGNDASARLSLSLSSGGQQIDAAAAIRPVEIPDHASLTGGTPPAADTNGLPNPGNSTFLISMDNRTPELVDITTVAASGNHAARMAEIAQRIQDAVRALRPTTPSYRDFTCVVNASRLVLTPGSRGAGSSVSVSAAAGDGLAGTLRLLAGIDGAFKTPAPNINLQGGSESAFTDAQAYGVYIGSQVNREGIYALEGADLFNIMCLPGVSDSGILMDSEAYCRSRRAFLIVDAPLADKRPDQIASTMAGAALPKSDHAAIYYPWIKIADPLNNGQLRNTAPSGTMAGLYARIDSNRGVWKSPAGTEATLTGVQGLEYTLTDGENGFLNPQGVNCLRVFPAQGAVSWGARTLAGADAIASEYKYIAVRRTALFIEESLYRGLKWVVFEPNDEPLWAQIRLNVGAFMHNLFRQGAFQGTKKKDAYFVKCDSETTTQNDINLGIVNIWVGFAPLKPAEFVILYLQQMTGQIEV